MTDQRQARRQAEIDRNKKTQTDAIVAPRGSFVNYKPVPGKPGFFQDEFGHLKYIPQ